MRRVSAGSFVVEPENLWRRRIPRHFLEQAPGFVASGDQSFVIPSEGIMLPVQSAAWHADTIATLTDPWARAEALEAAGIDAEIIYPTFAWSLFGIKDEALRIACLRCYNDWLIDLCAASPWRFGFAPLIAASETGCAELRRSAAKGAKAIVVGIGADGSAGSVLEMAATLGLPVTLARSGGSTPASDLAAFARESEALAGQHSGTGNRFVVLGGEGASGPDVLNVRASASLTGGAWGLLGQFAGSEGDALFLRETAMKFFGLKVGIGPRST